MPKNRVLLCPEDRRPCTCSGTGGGIGCPREGKIVISLKAREIELCHAVEFGFRQCEKGNNLQLAIVNFCKVQRGDKKGDS